MKRQGNCNKILFYISTIRAGGAARVIVNLANDFRAHGKEVCLVTNFPDEHEYPVSEGVIRRSLEHEESKKGVFQKNISRIRLLRKLIQDHNPDAVVSFMDENNFRMIIASLLLKKKVVISVRNDPKVKYRSSIKKIIVRLLYKLPSVVVLQTEEAKKWFSRSIQSKSVIIQNQVDPQFYTTQRISEDYYVAVGRLTKQKNLPLLIGGFSDLLKRHPKAVLRIYGSGELEAELKSCVEDAGHTGSIIFMGQTDNVPEVLSHAKCYIMTSDFEGMPNTLLEAMAVGLPVISTNCPCGGPAAVIEHEHDGLLFSVGNREELAGLLVQIEENSALRARLSCEAKKKAESFSPEFVFREWDKCICGS